MALTTRWYFVPWVEVEETREVAPGETVTETVRKPKGADVFAYERYQSGTFDAPADVAGRLQATEGEEILAVAFHADDAALDEFERNYEIVRVASSSADSPAFQSGTPSSVMSPARLGEVLTQEHLARNGEEWSRQFGVGSSGFT